VKLSSNAPWIILGVGVEVIVGVGGMGVLVGAGVNVGKGVFLGSGECSGRSVSEEIAAA
jgi:hypothetical protein